MLFESWSMSKERERKKYIRGSEDLVAVKIVIVTTQSLLQQVKCVTLPTLGKFGSVL